MYPHFHGGILLSLLSYSYKIYIDILPYILIYIRSDFLLANEKIILTSQVLKKTGLLKKKYQLILSLLQEPEFEQARLFFVDLNKMELKEEFKWNYELKVIRKDNKRFTIINVSNQSISWTTLLSLFNLSIYLYIVFERSFADIQLPAVFFLYNTLTGKEEGVP